MTLSERLDYLLRKLPDERGKFSEIAKKIGVSKQTFDKYKSGKIKNIPSNVIELLADTLHVTPSYLLGWEDYNLLPPEMFTDTVFREKIKKLHTLKDEHKQAVYVNIDFFYNQEKRHN